MQPTLWFSLHHADDQLRILFHVHKELRTLVHSQLALAHQIDLIVETTSELSSLLFCLMSTQTSTMLAVCKDLCMNLDSCFVKNIYDSIVITGYLGNLQSIMEPLIMFSGPCNGTVMGCVPIEFAHLTIVDALKPCGTHDPVTRCDSELEITTSPIGRRIEATSLIT